MYLKSRNILNISHENRLYRISNEKSIIDYIKEFFKKIIDFIKKWIDKIKNFFNFKQKQINYKIEIVKKEVNSVKEKTDKINDVIDVEVINGETNSITFKDILLAALNYEFNANTIDKIKDFCKYKFSCNVSKFLNEDIKNVNISSFNNINTISNIRNIKADDISKNLCKIGDIPFENSCLTFFGMNIIYFYDFDMMKNDFSKILSSDLNIDKKDLKVNITTADLKKKIDELSNFYNTDVKKYINELNSDLSLLTTNINKLEKNLEKDLSGSGKNISKDINEKLKVLSQHIRFATTNTVDTINNINKIIDYTLLITKDILK